MITPKEFTLGFLTFQHLLETYIDYRQHRKLLEKKIPSELKSLDLIKEDQFIKSQEYGAAKSSFGFVSDGFDFIITFLFTYFNGIPYVWDLSGEVLARFGFDPTSYEITRSIVFMFIFYGVEFVLKIPFSLYSTFVIEERFGFNKQTLGLFFVDLIKSILLTMALGVPLMIVILYIIKWGGPNFYIYVWLTILGFSLFFITVYPLFIAPLFNKFTPLEESDPLKEEIRKVAERVGFPLGGIYVMDGSKRSGHSNAFFYGFFKNKRIVLYDTLKTQLTTEQIIAVLAHELGHWKHNHILKNFVISNVHQFLIWYMFGQMLHSEALYSSFGFGADSGRGRPVFIGLLLFMTLLSPVNHIVSFAMNMLSRQFEYQADHFATTLGYDLVAPLAKIHVENLSDFVPDVWYSIYHYTHPTLLERISAMNKIRRGDNNNNKPTTTAAAAAAPPPQQQKPKEE